MNIKLKAHLCASSVIIAIIAVILLFSFMAANYPNYIAAIITIGVIIAALAVVYFAIYNEYSE